ncbi:hypothetical protein [Halalkalicoccus tibetensis]|uniref:Twin-arginine translocation signal domain-containing protein n=1 Tax=Halalkalicoccus tibetensis TaxID=175632 RepID=A0ABD5V8D1_9EURY
MKNKLLDVLQSSNSDQTEQNIHQQSEEKNAIDAHADALLQRVNDAGSCGGCLETAKAAGEERNNPSSRRQLLASSGTAIAALIAAGSFPGAASSSSDDLPDEYTIVPDNEGEGSFVKNEENDELVGYVEEEEGDVSAQRPTVDGYYCTGSIDLDCAEDVAENAGLTCSACAIAPTLASCVPCVGYAAINGSLGRGRCCSGGEWERLSS